MTRSWVKAAASKKPSLVVSMNTLSYLLLHFSSLKHISGPQSFELPESRSQGYLLPAECILGTGPGTQ